MRLIDADLAVKVIGKHTRKDGTLDNNLACILEEVPTAFDRKKLEEAGNVRWPEYIVVAEDFPVYRKSTRKGDTRKIKEIMEEYEYDDDLIENVNNDFCQGWDAARGIIVQILSDRYRRWEKAWKKSN